ncbi:MAG: putative metal-dependent hydrolase [Pedosphaera sp.]|nr:putative metal-dependent hydrolase [Pedosphaera sp.]
MSGTLSLSNHQRARRIDLRQLRWLLRDLLRDLLHAEDYDLSFHIVSAREMTRLNETHLRHAGSTDVITFDYSEGKSEVLAGEIFMCLEEALIQAARFHTTWQSELVRYAVHGLLHLRGYDDTRPVARRQMKREENRLLKELNRRFNLSKLERKTRLPA